MPAISKPRNCGFFIGKVAQGLSSCKDFARKFFRVLTDSCIQVCFCVRFPDFFWPVNHLENACTFVMKNRNTMKKIILVLSFLLMISSTYAQQCEGFYPVKPGTVIETQNFNHKGKLQAVNRQSILSVSQTGDGTEVKVKSEQFDEKNQPVYEQELLMKCAGDVFYMDMKDLLDPKTMSGFQDMEVTISGVDLEFPGAMQPGQMLRDGNIVVTVFSSGFKVMNMEVRIFNRKVEAIEPVTTPAGTYECYKVTYDTEVQSVFKVTAKGTEWIARNIGTVKSEQYDKNGKLTGYSLLSKFSN